MASSSSSGHSQRNVAIVLGSVAAAAVVGGLIYYYSRKNKNQRPSTSRKSEKAESKNKSGDEKPTKQATPLDKAVALKNKGNECFKNGQYAEAIKYYSEAIDSCPSDVSPSDLSAFYQNRAAAQEKLDNYAAVIEDCTKALEGNKRYVKAVVRRAKAYERLEKYKEALHDFTAACILEGFGNFTTMTSAEQVLKALGAERAKHAMAERAGRPIPLSRTFVDSYLLSFAEDPILNSLSASSNPADGSGDYKEANVALNGETVDTESLKGYEKAKLFLKTKKYDDIINACTEEIESNGENYLNAVLLRATFYLIMGSSKAASEDFDRLFEALQTRLPDDIVYAKRVKSNAYIKRGSLFMQHGKKDEALDDFQAAQDADPSNADVYHHRGQLLILLNELERARADFDKAVELRPDFAISLAQRCYANYRTAMAGADASRMHQAMAEFQKIIEKYPDCAEGFALYGQALAEHEEYEEAKRLFEKASELAPTNANIYVHKALLEAQSKNGDVGKSVEILEKALQIDPYCEFAYEALGTTELQRGNIDRALELYEKAIAFARTDLEMAHLFSLYEAAAAQKDVAKEFNVPLASLIPGLG